MSTHIPLTALLFPKEMGLVAPQLWRGSLDLTVSSVKNKVTFKDY